MNTYRQSSPSTGKQQTQSQPTPATATASLPARNYNPAIDVCVCCVVFHEQISLSLSSYSTITST